MVVHDFCVKSVATSNFLKIKTTIKEVILMTVICAWCKKEIKHIKDENVGLISHTICRECSKKLKNGGFEDKPEDPVQKVYDLDC